jgi:hypothetical protein
MTSQGKNGEFAGSSLIDVAEPIDDRIHGKPVEAMTVCQAVKVEFYGFYPKIAFYSSSAQ